MYHAMCVTPHLVMLLAVSLRGQIGKLQYFIYLCLSHGQGPHALRLELFMLFSSSLNIIPVIDLSFVFYIAFGIHPQNRLLGKELHYQCLSSVSDYRTGSPYLMN